jgi:hypothetical protein
LFDRSYVDDESPGFHLCFEVVNRDTVELAAGRI